MLKNNVFEYLMESAELYPAKIAIKDSDGEISYSKLLDKSYRISSYLIKKYNETKKLPIVVFLNKNVNAVISFLGIAGSGNFYIPIDVSQPLARIQKIFDVVNPLIVITSESNFSKLSQVRYSGDIVYFDELQNAMSDENIVNKVIRGMIDTDPLYMIFTSGSTGIPKGVVVSHRSVLDYTEWVMETYNICCDDIFGSQAPFYFDNSVLDIYSALRSGAELNLIPDNIFAFPLKIIEYINQNSISTIFWVPSVLINIANSNVLEKSVPKSLKKVLFAGEVMPTKQLNVWIKHVPDVLYSNLYGPTEITVDCTYYIINREFRDDEPLPIGIPCRNTDILLLKEDNTNAVQGEQGEICVRGSSLALGYYNNPEKTSEAFVQNPLNSHYPELIYKTGDLGYYNEYGELMFVGRKDFQIKHMGYRIELGEIEHLASVISSVKHVCILYNKEKKEITMFYEADAELTAGFIRTELGKTLPKYALPTVFRYMAELPRNANGKIDRQLLTTQM